jgi:hypothetical protein
MLNLLSVSSYQEVLSMVCRKCGCDALRREPRNGFLQMKVYPMFGLYPWECMMCRNVLLYRKQFPASESSTPSRAPRV